MHKRRILISNMPDGPRSEIHTWAKYDPSSANIEAAHASLHLDKVKKYFLQGRVRWWFLYDIEIDTNKGAVLFQMLESQNHDDPPPLELNTVAKGWVPTPKPKKKTVKKPLSTVGLQFSLPVEAEPAAQAFAAMAQGVVDVETEL